MRSLKAQTRQLAITASHARGNGGYRGGLRIELLGVSRSGYYPWKLRREAAPGRQAVKRVDLLVKIKVAQDASDGANGTPRITADLRGAGEVVTQDRREAYAPVRDPRDGHARGGRSP